MGGFARGVFTAKSALFQRADRHNAARMQAAERLPPERLAELRFERSIALARHAFRTTEFYREHYTRAGFSDRDFERAENFTELPILEKEDIRRGEDAMRSSTAPHRLLRSATGGSTGAPLVVLQDPLTPSASLWWRVHRWWGIHPSDDSAYIYRRSRTRRREALHRLKWWPTRQILLDARGMDDEAMRRFAEAWRHIHPALVTGYVDGLHEFAQFCDRSGANIPSPRAVAVTASVVTASKRAFIEHALGAPVYDCYRSAEVPWIAAQCAAQGPLHVLGDVRVLEAVDASGKPVPDDAQGDLLVTDLLNPAFPIIRYRIGDRSAMRSGHCACGMTLPRVDPIEGRVVDVLRTPEGVMVTGGLSVLFNDRPTAVTHFQLHQGADYAVTLRYVPGAADADEAAELVARRLREMLRGQVDVRAERVDRIEHIGGKARLVSTDLPELP